MGTGAGRLWGWAAAERLRRGDDGTVRVAAELRPAVLDVRRERGDRDVAGEKERKKNG
jgi:hypothetical protein